RTSHIGMESDEEGHFEGYLPEEGDWRVRLLGISPRFLKRLNGVEVRRRPGKKVAEVQIVLPDNRVGGVVVDELGLPVHPGVVHGLLLGEDGLLAAPVDPEGRFEFRGLGPGTIRLTADAEGDRLSDEVTVEVVEDMRPAPVELIVRERITVRGRVVSGGAGMPEVRIQAWPAHLPLTIGGPIGTDMEGRFELKLPKTTAEAAVNVLARGFALRMLRIPVSPERELIIPVHSISGDLLLEFEAPPETDYRMGSTVVVLHNGSWMDLSVAGSWAALSGAGPDLPANKILIPDLEPGNYTVCAVKTPELARVIMSNGAADGCVGGYLAPGGELALEVPTASP
ncbi:MAG: carboxypeptidase regulatory-like domain-containing protein, partial [bacterium]|nr:carboxypeptidase regulatory-like domain-containing protein [bacterium]